MEVLERAATPPGLWPAGETLSGDALIAAVRALADGPLAELADDIDRRGIYPKSILQRLGELGALRAHLADGDTPADYGLAIRAMTEVSRVCGATGFMVWCHAVCGVYMQQSGNPALMGERLARHSAGQTLGATGMSNPMKTFAGIETFLLHARKVEGGYRVSGTLPWVSNLGPDHYFGAVADVEGSAQEIMFLVHCNAPGVELRNCPSFSAMEGTNTWAVRLTDYLVGAQDLIAEPVRPFIGRIRAAFILLQTGMGLGVAQGAIDSMWKVERQLGHVNEFLDDRPDTLQDELDALTARIMTLAQTPFGSEREFLIDVLDSRAHASELALRAAQSALLHQGARGYLMTSDVQRRVRESHFVAIVTPAIKHLRKEIARLSAEEQPA
ncbi:MAG: acyl-CoA dehydrogenase family protein [Polaromonas sp.]|uniref:acyl-CoA dehydrogenase family protein n=1 Tax=Polaromonas sp. TaxID=1869339 RepID=UPI004036B3A5